MTTVDWAVQRYETDYMNQEKKEETDCLALKFS